MKYGWTLGLLFLLHISNIFSYSYHERDSLDKIMHQAIEAHAFPGACVAAGTKNQIFIQKCFGYHTYEKVNPNEVTDIFDIASLTKIIATTASIMKLYDEGKISLDDKVVKYLPAFKGPNYGQTQLKSELTIRDLLTHSSGLPADNNVAAMKTATVDARWRATFKTPVVRHRHYESIYSDVNFEILGKIIEKVSGLSLDQYSKKFIFDPLDMRDTFFNPPQQLQSKIIPARRPKLGEENLVRAQDEIAYSLGGISGHAGLFSTIQDLSRFAQMLLNKGVYKDVQIYKPETIAVFATRDTSVQNSTRALGWDTVFEPKSILPKKVRAPFYTDTSPSSLYPEPQNFTAGLYIDSDAIGHTGYTGVSLWISFKYGVFVILLTNHILPCAEGVIAPSHKYWRQRINSAVWRNLGFNQKNLLYEEPPIQSDPCVMSLR